MSTTTIHKESFYQAKIIKWLEEQYPGAFVWKAQAGPYCRQGIPDICAIIDGHFFGFEVKRPELGRLSKIQEQTLKEINAAGGTTAVVSYPADCQKIIATQKAAEETARVAAAALYYSNISRNYARLESREDSIRGITGMDLDQLLENFLAGYELRPPDKEGGDNSAGIS